MEWDRLVARQRQSGSAHLADRGELGFFVALPDAAEGVLHRVVLKSHQRPNMEVEPTGNDRRNIIGKAKADLI